MRVKRGQNYPGLNFSGPQSTNVINEAEELAERLEARNQWAYQMRAYYPDLPEILQVERCTEYPVTRFRRELVLRFDATDGWWEIVGHEPPKASDGDAAPEGGGDAPDDGDGGGQPRQPAPKPSTGMRKATTPKPDTGDEYRPISKAPRRALARERPQSQLAAYLWKVRAYVRRSSLFRHTTSVFEDNMGRMKRAVDQFVEEARDALLLAYGFRTSFSNSDQVVQESWLDAVFEQRVFERAGRRLTLLTFSAYPEPKWECWLFGRLPEDEQVAA